MRIYAPSVAKAMAGKNTANCEYANNMILIWRINATPFASSVAKAMADKKATEVKNTANCEFINRLLGY